MGRGARWNRPRGCPPRRGRWFGSQFLDIFVRGSRGARFDIAVDTSTGVRVGHRNSSGVATVARRVLGGTLPKRPARRTERAFHAVFGGRTIILPVTLPVAGDGRA